MENTNPHIDYDLLIKYLSNNCNEVEQNAVNQWLDSSVENANYFAQLKLIWIESASSHYSSEEEIFDVDTAWNTVSKRIFTEKKTRIFNLNSVVRIAAVFVLIASSIFFYNRLNVSSNSQEIVYQGELDYYKQKLQDSTTIVLSKNSELLVEDGYGTEHRTVSIEKGDVYFDVEKDSSLPFIIKTNSIQVQVYGTSFNVNTNSNDSTVVNVETGIVELTYQDQKIFLKAGERAVWYRASGKFKKTPIYIKTKYWLGAFLDFRGKRLDDVFASSQNLYGLEFKFDKAVGQKRIHVKFQDESIDTILDVISMTMNIELELVDEVYLVKDNNE